MQDAAGTGDAGTPVRVLVVGVGNPYRRDDGVGIAVARALRALALPGVEVCERCGEGTDLIAAWADHRVVFVVDAVRSGVPHGTVHRFEPTEGQSDSNAPLVPARIFRGTSHQIGVGEAIELGRLLGTLPSRLVVYGVEGAEFRDGVGLSAPVEQGAAQVVISIAAECSAIREAATPQR
jgi:hydrogenase maturation protease